MPDDKLIKSPAEIVAEENPAKLIGIGRTTARGPQRTAEEMAGAARATVAEAGATLGSAAAAAADRAEAGIEQGAAAAETVTELLTGYQQQSLKRMNEAMNAFWQCRTLSDMVSIQMRYVTESFRDGMEHATRLAQLSMEQSTRGVEGLGRH